MWRPFGDLFESGDGRFDAARLKLDIGRNRFAGCRFALSEIVALGFAAVVVGRGSRRFFFRNSLSDTPNRSKFSRFI